MRESQMSMAVTPSLSRKLFNNALEMGDDVIDLTLGDPDIMPPEEIRAAACEAIMQGKTRYSANAGLMDVRCAYASFVERQYGFSVNPRTNVMATVGGMEGLYLSLSAIVDRDDEVIILAPYYVNYQQMIRMLGGKAVIVNRIGMNESEIVNAVEDAITERTVCIVINSPCNPMGDILPKVVLDGIAKISIDNDLLVISDEVYSSLVYDNDKAESIINCKGMVERTILIDSCSKRFAMTGWRIGFAVGPEDIIANMTKMQENIAACAPLPSQYAAIRAYQENFDYSYIQKEYENRRNLVYKVISEIDVLSCEKPQATFYCFVNISKTGLDSETFAYKLLEEQHVAVVPGKTYGEAYDNYIRIAFTLNDEILQKALMRLKKFCESVMIN